MARGNQRDKAREKNQKAASQEKHKTTASGTEQARNKENVAAIMRAKQAAADAKKAADGKK
ncbi:four F5 [Teratosphaeria destructans]|uniref:Four F5 n=1 Tax=Teratosphaeria destructans TaxID=418781 RepID=A0A9W7VY98_9PEZI|nr:four F5 [Teratosphaeria destructans]